MYKVKVEIGKRKQRKSSTESDASGDAEGSAALSWLGGVTDATWREPGK